MVKTVLFLIFGSFPLATFAQWTEEEKQNFKENCMQYAYVQGIKDEAKVTCECVLQKFLVKYPRAIDASEHGGKHIARYTLMCLPTTVGKWHPIVESQFINVCLENAKNNGKINNPNNFCACMMKNFQAKYSQSDMLNLSEKDKNLQMLEMGTDCIFDDGKPQGR